MLASEGRIGQMYILEARAYRPKGAAECVGWNHTHEFMLFLVFDEYKKRKILTVAPTEIIQAVEQK